MVTLHSNNYWFIKSTIRINRKEIKKRNRGKESEKSIERTGCKEIENGPNMKRDARERKMKEKR